MVGVYGFPEKRDVPPVDDAYHKNGPPVVRTFKVAVPEPHWIDPETGNPPFTDTFKLVEEDVPHAFKDFTKILPPTFPEVKLMEEEFPPPLHPEGIVHL